MRKLFSKKNNTREEVLAEALDSVRANGPQVLQSMVLTSEEREEVREFANLSELLSVHGRDYRPRPDALRRLIASLPDSHQRVARELPRRRERWAAFAPMALAFGLLVIFALSQEEEAFIISPLPVMTPLGHEAPSPEATQGVASAQPSEKEQKMSAASPMHAQTEVRSLGAASQQTASQPPDAAVAADEVIQLALSEIGSEQIAASPSTEAKELESIIDYATW
jgi:hypothetical protein